MLSGITSQEQVVFCLEISPCAADPAGPTGSLSDPGLPQHFP